MVARLRWLTEQSWFAPAMVAATLAIWVSSADQYDFEVYYISARAKAAGLSPYDPANFDVQGMRYLFAYVYTPMTLWLFRPFVFVSLATAKAIWLALKLAGVVVLVTTWQRIIPLRNWMAWTLLLVVGFNRTLWKDLHHGNASLFEVLLIWLAIAAFVRGRTILFASLIAAAAMFKLLPLYFLGLLLVAERRPKIGVFIGALAAFAAIVDLNFLISPSDSKDWLNIVTHHLGSHRGVDSGMNNPSMLALLRDAENGFIGSDVLADRLAIVVAGIAMFVLVRIAWTGRNRLDNATWRLGLTMTYVLTWALITPRFMNYAYVLLLPAAYYVASKSRTRMAVTLAISIIGLALALAQERWPPLQSVGNASIAELQLLLAGMQLVAYQALILAVILWLWSVRDLSKQPEMVSA